MVVAGRHGTTTALESATTILTATFSRSGGYPMFDVLFVAVTFAFFAITLAYTTGCERL